MRVWINKRSVGLVQSVNIKEGRVCYLTVEYISLYRVATSSKFYNFGRPAIISADCCPAILQHFDLNSMWWILRCCEAKNWMWSYLGGPLWYCWLHCKSHPRLHPTWSQVKSHYQLLRRVMSRYLSIHNSQERTRITISAAENVWKGSATYW